MRGQAHECGTRAVFFLQAAFFSCSLPLLAPAAQSFSLHSLTFPSGAAGRETVERLLKHREQPRCGQHGKRKHFCTNKCPYSLMRQFFVSYEPIKFMLLLSAWAIPDCVEGLSRSTLSGVYVCVQTEFCIGSQPPHQHLWSLLSPVPPCETQTT